MASAYDPALPGVQQAIDAAFERTARRWERFVTAARVPICLVMLVRTILIWNEPWASRERIQLAPILAAGGLYIAASFALLRSGAPIKRVLMLSVALDTVYVFTAFLPNTLWPWPGYLGIVNTPDIAWLYVAIVLAGLRLAPGVAVFGSILNIISFIALLLIDLHVSDLPLQFVRFHQYALQATFLVTAVTLSIVVAVRTRRLVNHSMHAALKAERAERGFDAILHEHHDVRTLLSAARLNADRLASGAQTATGTLVEQLRGDLNDVEGLLNAIRARSYGELLALGSRHTVDVFGIAHEVLDRMRRRFPATALVLHGRAGVAAQVAGGDVTLRRLLLNVVTNACEGDGERSAAHVDVDVRTNGAGGRVSIDVFDDGPGFSPEVLATELGDTCSTKVGGSGFGLGVALALAQASDGTLTRGNRSAGGAVVSLSLPLARSG